MKKSSSIGLVVMLACLLAVPNLTVRSGLLDDN